MESTRRLFIILLLLMFGFTALLFSVNTSVTHASETEANSEIEESITYLKSDIDIEAAANMTNEIIENGSVTEKREYYSYSGGGANTDTKVQILIRLYWVDDYGATHPLVNVKVIARTYLGFYCTSERISYADWGGMVNYEANGTVYTDFEIFAGNEKVQTYKNNNSKYFYKTNRFTINEYNQALLTFSVNSNDNLGKAFRVSQALHLGQDYVARVGLTDVSFCKLLFPSGEVSGNTRAFYKQDSKTIHINAYWNDWSAIVHEYGHHVAKEKGIDGSPGGDYDYTDNLANLNFSKDTAIRIAWSEAWAEMFAYLVWLQCKDLNQSVWQGGDNNSIPYDPNSSYGVNFGEAHIAAIINVFYHLLNSLNSNTTFWSIVMESGAITLSDFINFCFEDDRVNHIRLGEILEENNISPSNVTVSTDSGLPTFSWNPGGGSVKCTNNLFYIVFFLNGYEFYRIININSTSYTVTDEQWARVIQETSTITYAVSGYQTGTPLTGGYMTKQFSIPTNVHIHNRNTLEQHNATHHKIRCSCGDYVLQTHNLLQAGQWLRCVCGYQTKTIIVIDNEIVTESIGFPYITQSLLGTGLLSPYYAYNSQHINNCH